MFFGNDLNKEILEAILEKNYNLSILVEQELLEYFSKEVREKERSFHDSMIERQKEKALQESKATDRNS